MALVLNTEASNESSVNLEMLFVVYEATKATDPTTYPDYAYICDIYVSGNLVDRLISRPDPTYNRGVFDVSKALQSYVTYAPDLLLNKVDYTAKVEYQLKFGEQYDGTTYTNLLVDSSNREAYKAYVKRPFVDTERLTNGLASNMPSVVNWNRNRRFQLVNIFSNVSGITDLVQTYRDAAGNSLGTQTFSNSDYVAKTIRQFNLGSPPVGAEYSDITGAGITSLRVNHTCDGKFTPYVLVWLNPYGGYDSQSFGMVSKKSIETSRKTFEQLPYRLNASGEVSYHENRVYYGGKRAFNTGVKTKFMMTSHLLNEDEYTWLHDLFVSPEVYLLEASLASIGDPDDLGKFIPVTIGSNTYEFKNYANSRLTAFQFEVEFPEVYNSQFL
jgi:hypothetical protein